MSSETAIGRPTATGHRLVEASISPNTRRTYAGALGHLDAWLDGRQLEGRQSRRLPPPAPALHTALGVQL